MRPIEHPILVAHRGWGKWLLPENSAEAFRFARDGGWRFVECDVWAASDGEPVVLHDETLDRTTVGSGDVRRFSAAQLGALKLRNAEGAPTDACLPLLRDVRELVDYVEVKPADAPNLVQRTIDIMSPRTDWVLQSFDEANLVHARVHGRRSGRAPTCVALLVEDARGIDVALAGGWQIHIDHRLLDVRMMRRLRDAGMRVGAWTVNAEEDARRIWELRPDVIISDHPDVVSRVVMSAAK